MSDMFDVCVAGGGPAGAVTALCLARRGIRVALFEATGFDTERFGETLPPEINPVLKELDLWDAFSALGSLEAPGILSCWGSDSPVAQDFVSNAYGCGWHVDRNRFDAMLCREAARAGAKLLLNRRAPEHVHAGYLVDASSRTGLRTDVEHRYERDDSLIAISLRVAGSSRDLWTIIETTPHGWWYSAPVPSGETVAMFFTDPEIYTTEGIVIGDELAQAPLTCERMGSTRIVATRILHATSSCRRWIVGSSWLAVGDSASSYDPLSGRGVFKALRHGLAAARAIAEGSAAAYSAMVRDEFKAYVRQRRMYYAGECRWPGSIFWNRRTTVVKTQSASQGL
jgi:flavin-dependent dehydrogenase